MLYTLPLLCIVTSVGATVSALARALRIRARFAAAMADSLPHASRAVALRPLAMNVSVTVCAEGGNMDGCGDGARVGTFVGAVDGDVVTRKHRWAPVSGW